MAEQGKVIDDLTGNSFSTPSWALDSTMVQISKQLNVLVVAAGKGADAEKDIKAAKKAIEKLEAAWKKGNDKSGKTEQKIADDEKKINEEIKQALHDIKDQIGKGGSLDPKALEEYHRTLADAESGFGKFYDGLSMMGKATIGLAGSIGLGLFKAVQETGRQLNALTESGLGFGDAQGSSIKALGTLSLAGIDAASMLSRFSRAGAVLGVNRFADLSHSFMQLSDAGLDLGLTLEQNADRYAQELDTRAKLGILNQVSAIQVQRETMTTMKTQQLYAQALGQTTENLQIFANELVTQTSIVSGSLLRFNGTVQSQVVAGLKDFGSTMMGLGGKGGADIAEAMTQAAAGGALGFSQELAQYTAVLPRLQNTTNKLTNAFQQGTLTQEQSQEIARSFAGELGNLSQQEKERIFAMERAGVEGATEMANAVRNFTASAKRMDELKVNPSAVQKGTNALSNILNMIAGMFEKIKYDFLDGFGSAITSAGDLGKVFEQIQKIIMTAIAETFGGALGETTGSIKDLGKHLGEKIGPLMIDAAKWIADLITKMPAILDSIAKVAKGFVDVVLWMAGFGKIIVTLGIAMASLIAIIKLYAMAQTVAASSMMKNFSGGKFFDTIKNKLTGGSTGKTGIAAANITGQMQDGASKSGAAAGGMKTFGSGFRAMMIAITKGLKTLGKAAMNPMVWAGLGLLTVAILAIATALRIAAPGIEAFGKLILNVFKGIAEVLKAAGVIIFNIMKGMGAIIKSVMEGIGAIFESVGKAITSVFKGIGAVIESVGNAIKSVMQGIGAIITSIGKAIATVFLSIGSAAQMMGNGIKMIFDGISGTISSFKDFILAIGSLDGVQLLGAAGGIAAVGAALVALGAGGLVSGIARGLGNLFADDPIGQFIELGKVAPGINNMAEEMRNFGGTVDAFTDALKDLDGDMVKTQMSIIADAFKTLEAALNEISWVNLAKLAAFKFIDNITGAKSKADAVTGQKATDAITEQAGGKQAVITKKVAQKQGLPDNFQADYSQRDFATNDPESYKEYQAFREQKEDEYLADNPNDFAQAELYAERDALKEFAPKIAKADAGTFTTPDGTPITFGEEGKTVAPKSVQAVTPTSTQVATGERPQAFAGESEIGADGPIDPLTKVASAGETERPIKEDVKNSELLQALNENNRLLAKHINVSKDIADQI